MTTFITPSASQSVGQNAYDAIAARALGLSESSDVTCAVNSLIGFVVAQFHGPFTDDDVLKATNTDVNVTDPASLRSIPPHVLPVAVVRAITKQDLKIRLTKIPAWSKFMSIYGQAIIRVK